MSKFCCNQMLMKTQTHYCGRPIVGALSARYHRLLNSSALVMCHIFEPDQMELRHSSDTTPTLCKRNCIGSTCTISYLDKFICAKPVSV